MYFVGFVAKPKKFNDQPFAYHAELELEIATLTNLGSGLGRVRLPEIENRDSKNENSTGWVVMVPFALPGERVRVRVFRNHKNFSEADLLKVLAPSPDRVAARCARGDHHHYALDGFRRRLIPHARWVLLFLLP